MPPPLPGGPPPLPKSSPHAAPPSLAGAARKADAQTVTTMSTQAAHLVQTDRAGEAETMLREALELSETKLGEEDPLTSTCLSNLGDFLSQRGRFEEAEPTLRRAVAIQEAHFGVDHPETGTALSNLALALRRTGQLAEAEPLYRRVLAIFESTHGPEHILVAGVLNNLAQVLAHTGRATDAEPLMRRAIGLFEQQFGANDVRVAVALNNLARLMEETGRAAEAEPLSRRHLQIFQAFENETGDPHTYKGAAVQGYGDLLLRLGLSQDEARARIHAILQSQPLADLPAPGTLADPATPGDFDALCKQAMAGGPEDRYRLYAAAFRLKEWHFLARGEFPDLHPYLAANPGIANGEGMVKAFTDPGKLQAFAKECQLLEPDGGVRILSMPVDGIMPTLAGYAAQGLWGIHFNADSGSDGFFAPLEKLPALREHLEGLGMIHPESVK